MIVVLFGFFSTVRGDVNGGYFYPQPFPPLQFDEPTSVPNVYVPPTPKPQDDGLKPPVSGYLPPEQFPPLGTSPDIFSDDTVPINPVPTVYGPPPPQIKVINMSCELDASFQCTIKLAGQSTIVPEEGNQNCLIPLSGNTFQMKMQGLNRMGECGVKRCTNGNGKVNMCVTLRMPTVNNLKLPEDATVNLQCSPQESVVAHTKHIRIGSNVITANRGRSSSGNSVVVSGGGQRNFDSKLNLFRKSTGSDNFDQLVLPGSTVTLGEELVLRAAVQDGDGWQGSKISLVTIRSGSIQKSINLLDENGCPIPSMRHVCPHEPKHLTHLITILPFRAFLFQGAGKDDVMLLSVKITGCARSQDCNQNICGDPSKTNLRFRRGLSGNGTGKREMTDWETEFQFRVSDEPEKGSFTEKIPGEYIVFLSTFGLLVLIVLIVLVLRKIFRRDN
ncbi:uncharacterized protein LOC109602078 isoform X2 [Aethina tumida]|uniref:uncharacterized protein LOC109602078 isoform X2 n=1 Tax=Aethina tumida TaxID=116153 RepID=UPI0021479128|nr:uncharacterized protein LOC109602078 isoform X2 [Aethina tumida]